MAAKARLVLGEQVGGRLPCSPQGRARHPAHLRELPEGQQQDTGLGFRVQGNLVLKLNLNDIPNAFSSELQTVCGIPKLRFFNVTFQISILPLKFRAQDSTRT